MTKMAKAKTKSKPHRLSRPLLDKMLLDLIGRLVDLECEADGTEIFIKPNGQHMVIEYQTRTACGVLIESLQRRIRDVRGLAEILFRNEAL
jgi:hypothetical protein